MRELTPSVIHMQKISLVVTKQKECHLMKMCCAIFSVFIFYRNNTKMENWIEMLNHLVTQHYIPEKYESDIL